MTDVMDVEIVDEDGNTLPQPEEEAPSTAALVPAQQTGGLMRPVATKDDVVAAFQQYQELRQTIVGPDDTVSVNKKQYVTKSGWRKLAVVMNVSTELVSRTYDRDEQGRIVRAEVVVRAIAPNGRSWDGLGICDVHERCCPKAWGGVCKSKERNHIHCEDGCNGFIHFSKPQHDIPATAHTRASNRACADLFGFGEVSAEEVTDHEEPADPADIQALVNAMNAIADEEQRKIVKSKFIENFGMPNELVRSQIPAAQRWISAHGLAITAGEPESVASNASDDSAPSSDATAQPQQLPQPDEGSPAVPSDATPEPPEASGPEAPAAPTDTSSDGVVEGKRITGGGRASNIPQPAKDAPPATNQQKQRIAMLVNELVKEGKLQSGDKAVLTIAVSGDLDRSSTTQITFEEAKRYLALLQHIKAGKISLVDHEGERAFLGHDQIGNRFLDELPIGEVAA